MSLDDILPKREFITLTEAATAIAFGTSETADAYAGRIQAENRAAHADLRKAEGPAEEAAQRAGLQADWRLIASNPLLANLTTTPPELTALHVVKVQESVRTVKMIDDAKRLDLTTESLIKASAGGHIQVFGHSDGPTSAEIPARDLLRAYSNYFDNELDALVVVSGSNLTRWSGTTVRRTTFVVWALSQQHSQSAVAREAEQQQDEEPERLLTTKDVNDAIEYVAAMLKERGEQLKKGEAMQALKLAKIRFSQSGFNGRKGIWARGRERAGMEPKARSGPKKKMAS